MLKYVNRNLFLKNEKIMYDIMKFYKTLKQYINKCVVKKKKIVKRLK